MDKYFFVLGRYPEISLAEINTVLKKNNLNYSPALASREIAVFSIASKADLAAVFASLGGSVKFGRILAEVLLDEKETEFQKFFESNFLKEQVIPKGTKKLHFGISVYECGSEKDILDKLSGSLKDLNRTIKNNLKSAGYSSGFLRIKERTLSSVAVAKNQLLRKGFEIILITASGKIIIGKTNAVQDFTSFTNRDINRPKKDKKSGILPVKLARIMINLLPISPRTLLDPFCGSGTVLMEAALLGIKNLIGTDIASQAVANTQANLDWLFNEYNFKTDDIDIKLKIADIKNLDKVIGYTVADAIVTEPYLGPRLFSQPDEFQANKILAELIPLYRDSLHFFHRLLKDKGYAVMIFPFFQTRNKNYFMDKNIILKSEFRMLNSYMYSSPGQFVGREIIVLEKT